MALLSVAVEMSGHNAAFCACRMSLSLIYAFEHQWCVQEGHPVRLIATGKGTRPAFQLLLENLKKRGNIPDA